MVSWKEPGTFTAGQVVTNSALNEEVRDQLSYLKAMPRSQYTGSAAITLTNTTFALIGAGFSGKITSYGGDIELSVMFNRTVSDTALLSPYLDGSGVHYGAGGAGTGIGYLTGPANMTTVRYVWTGIASGVHTVELHARVRAGQMDIYDAAMRQFIAREVTTSGV